MAPSPILAVLFDSGDTLIDEGSEIKEGKITLEAEFLPGAYETLDEFRHQYQLAIVANGYQQSYVNTLTKLGVWDWFEVVVSSELTGAEKPDPAPFRMAMDELEIPGREHEQVVMVGNLLDKDVAGAQALGMKTIWLTGSPRYEKSKATPNPDPKPDQTISSLYELPAALDAIAATLA